MTQSNATSYDIFVTGLDDFNRRQFDALALANQCRFHALLSIDELKDYGNLTFQNLLGRARERLDAFEGTPDAIVTHWDFPATLLVALLTSERGLSGSDLQSCLKCEHKYWFRHEQQQLGQEDCQFQAINPFAEQPFEQVELDFPFWLKPVKGTNSMLGFAIESEADFEAAIGEIRESIGLIAEPFNEILKLADLPREVAEVDGHWCIAESFLSGSQHTASGYMTDGKAHVYGVIDSENYPESSNFLAYIYPSKLPDAVQQRIAEKSEALIERIGLDQSAFNIEYFYDAETDHLAILEVNPRISQSHCDIYRRVDGESNESLVLQLGLGQPPQLPSGEGDYAHAAKFYQRVFQDAKVRRSPTASEVQALEEAFDALIHIKVEEGQRLSDLFEQDTSSYAIAELFVGGETRAELHHKFDEIVARLHYELD